MDTLPAELVAMIGEYLSKYDLKRLRRVNAHISASVAPRLFDAIDATARVPVQELMDDIEQRNIQHEIDIFYGSAPYSPRMRNSRPLTKLLRVAGDQRFAPYVKCLKIGVICPGTYDECRGEVLENAYLPGIRIYLSRIEGTMAFALPKMINLQDVHIVGNCSKCWRSDYWNERTSVCYPHKMSNRISRVAKMVLTHFSHDIRRGKLRHIYHAVPRISHLAIYSDTPVLHNVTWRLKSLSLNINTRDYGWAGLRTQALPCTDVLFFAKALEDLSLSWSSPPCSYDGDRPEIAVPIAAILSLPLKRLSLGKFSFVGSSSNLSLLYPNSADHATSSRGQLHTLRLFSSQRIHAEHILALLIPNALTLCNMNLIYLHLTSGEWSSIFQYMYEKILKLRDLNCSDLGYDYDGESAHLAGGNQDDFTYALYQAQHELYSADPTEYGVLNQLADAVRRRREASDDRMRVTESDNQPRIQFGPPKRKHTGLDKWLGVPPM